MKTRPLYLLVLSSLIGLAFVTPAAAQQPIPNIKQTSQFRALKTYVSVLESKRSIPADSTKKSDFRAKLVQKRSAANSKAKTLYTRRITRISKQDDNKERRQIKRIRQNQKAQVATLNGNLSSRLAKLQGKENTAVDRINRNYTARVTPLLNKREALQKKLDKAKTPAKREALTTKINRVQKQINVLANARQSDLDVVQTKYNGRIGNLRDLFAAKISRVKTSSARQIKQAHNAYKRLFKEQIGDAKEKQRDEISLVTDLRDRGAGYIDEMPPVVSRQPSRT